MSTMFPKKPEAVPLYYAARLGFCDLAKHLIAEHPEHVNARGGEDVTMLHAAARAGHVDILSLLLEHGADMSSPGYFDGTPLHGSSLGGEVNAGQFLLDRGADINARDRGAFTPLFRAVANEDVETVRMLLERGARTDGPHDNAYDGAVLHRGVRAGNIQVLQLLLEHGADANARDKSGKTPSQLTEQQEIQELLSKYGTKSGE